jgi:hypothetical protein
MITEPKREKKNSRSALVPLASQLLRDSWVAFDPLLVDIRQVRLIRLAHVLLGELRANLDAGRPFFRRGLKLKSG